MKFIRKVKIIKILFIVMLLLNFQIGIKAEESENEVQYVELMDYVKNLYDESNGMPTSEANTILQDDKGYIWIGSYSGLSRYNAHEFENVSHTRENAPKDGIRILYLDSLNRLWIGTNDDGLYLFQDETFTHVSSITDLSIRSIVEDQQHQIYIGTTNGLMKLNDELEIVPFLEDDFAIETIENLFVDENNILWGTSSRNRLFAIQEETMKFFLDHDDLGINLGKGIVQNRKGELFVGTDSNYLLRIDGISEDLNVRNLTIDQLFLGNLEGVNDIYIDSEGRMWICSEYGIGYFLEDDTFYEVSAHFNNISIEEMMEDYEGNLWLASTRKGVYELSKSKLKNISYKIDIAEKNVNATLLHQKNLYIGTNTGIAIMDEHGKSVENRLTSALKGIRIRHIMSDREGNLWISTYKDYGLIRYDVESDSWISFNQENGLPHSQIRMALELDNGDIAVASNGGVAIIKDDQVIKTYTYKDGIHNEIILCLVEGRDNKLFAGSDGNGIYSIDLVSDEVENLTVEDGLSSGVILRMVADKDVQGIWISNGSYLTLWQEDGIHELADVGAGSGSIFDMKPIGEQIILMKSSCLIKMNKSDLIEGSPVFDTIERKDGLLNNITANSWSYFNGENELYLCSGGGVYFLDLNEIYKNKTVPKIAIGSIVVDGQSCYGLDQLDLASDVQRLTLNLDLLSFSFSYGKLMYYLEGFDEEWQTIDDRFDSQVSYTNLKGGDYIFHLKGYNIDETESEELILPIRKELSFFEESYFIGLVLLIVVLVLLSLIVILQYLNKKRIMKRQQEYKRITDLTIRTVAKTIDAKDKYTIGHSNRVATYSVEIGRRFGLDDEQLEHLYYTALLHDIGKIGIPDDILNKPGRLTDEEYAIIKTHTSIGGGILKDLGASWIIEGAEYHHERYDGKGYNHGLKGEEIPLFARIICVADAYDGMNSTRVYRSHLSKEVIYEEVKRGMGTQFDPTFAKIMLEMIDDGFEAE